MRLGVYKHYSGKLYKTIGIASHSESLEKLVVYQQLYEDYKLWVRPLQMFTENVVIKGIQRPRFEFIRELDDTAGN